MNRVFNTDFEMSLRILILLSVAPPEISLSADRIYLYDFIICYSKYFGISDSNIFGNTNFSHSELPTRRELTRDAIKLLVRQGVIDVIVNDYGFTYKINKPGEIVLQGINSPTKNMYIECSKKTYEQLNKYSDNQLTYAIYNKKL